MRSASNAIFTVASLPCTVRMGFRQGCTERVLGILRFLVRQLPMHTYLTTESSFEMQDLPFGQARCIEHNSNTILPHEPQPYTPNPLKGEEAVENLLSYQPSKHLTYPFGRVESIRLRLALVIKDGSSVAVCLVPNLARRHDAVHHWETQQNAKSVNALKSAVRKSQRSHPRKNHWVKSRVDPSLVGARCTLARGLPQKA